MKVEFDNKHALVAHISSMACVLSSVIAVLHKIRNCLRNILALENTQYSPISSHQQLQCNQGNAPGTDLQKLTALQKQAVIGILSYDGRTSSSQVYMLVLLPLHTFFKAASSSFSRIHWLP